MTKKLLKLCLLFLFSWSTIQGVSASHCGGLFGSGIERLVERGTTLVFEFQTGFGLDSLQYEFNGTETINGMQTLRWRKTGLGDRLIIVNIFLDARGIWEVGPNGEMTSVLNFGASGVTKVEDASASRSRGGSLVGGFVYKDGKLRHDDGSIMGPKGQPVGGDLYVKTGPDGKSEYYLSSLGLVDGGAIYLKEIKKGDPLP